MEILIAGESRDRLAIGRDALEVDNSHRRLYITTTILHVHANLGLNLAYEQT